MGSTVTSLLFQKTRVAAMDNTITFTPLQTIAQRKSEHLIVSTLKFTLLVLSVKTKTVKLQHFLQLKNTSLPVGRQ